MSNKEQELSFEEQMSQLEQLVSELERGELSLDDAMKKFEQGVALTRQCQKALADAEQRVSQLMSDGSIEPFEGDKR